MQAIEKIVLHTNWVSIICVSLIAFVAILKVLDVERLKGSVFALFNKGFIEDEVEENTSFFDLFQIVLFIFSITTIALTLNFIRHTFQENYLFSFQSFLYLFVTTFVYFLVKFSLESSILTLFLIQKELRFYRVSKHAYLYSISFVLFVFFLLFHYNALQPTFFLPLVFFLFAIKFLIHFINNKKLVFSKLFYFILYICAFEIAPLFILFKLML